MSEYAKSGVSHDRKDAGLSGMVAHLRGTFGNNPRARVGNEHGYYASVVEIAGSPLAIAICDLHSWATLSRQGAAAR